MTVAELIKELAALPQEAQVVLDDTDLSECVVPIAGACDFLAYWEEEHAREDDEESKEIWAQAVLALRKMNDGKGVVAIQLLADAHRKSIQIFD